MNSDREKPSYNAIPSTSIPISTKSLNILQCKEGLIWGLHIPPTPSHNYCLGDTANQQKKEKIMKTSLN